MPLPNSLLQQSSDLNKKNAKTKKSIENLKAATENIKSASPDAKSDKDASDLIDRREGAKSIFSEGDTADYIKNLLKGSGASINFDQLRDELNGKGDGNSFAQTISSHASIDHHTRDENSISNLDSFNEFLKSQQQDPNISQIPQRAFYSSQNSERSALKPSSIFKENRDTASSVGSRNPLGTRDDNRQILNVGDLENSPVKHDLLSTMTNISTSHDDHSHLKKISKRLVGYSFSPLHPSLLVTTADNQHVPGTLTDSQAFYLFNAFSTLMNEYDNRGNAIQNLINQLARNSSESNLNKENFSNSENKDIESLLRIQELERQIHELKQELEQKTYMSEKLQFEAKAKLLREESARNRNQAMLEAIKQKYFFDTPGLEPVISTIIETYEDRLTSMQNSSIKNYKDFGDYSTEVGSLPSPNKNLESELKLVKEELLATQQENELLKLKLINQNHDFHGVEEEVEKIDASAISTRDKIHRDKKLWRLKQKKKSGPDVSSHISHQDSKAVLKEICRKLGITDFENIFPAIEKIQLVFRLIPQMEQFIRDVNATISAYNINASKDNSIASSIAPSPQKLSESLKIIRHWADNMASTSEHQKFISDIHEVLHVQYSAGSLEKCLVEIQRIFELSFGDSSTSKPAPNLDLSQKIVAHLLGLFHIEKSDDVIDKMNELYVFSAEVNDGLMRLREALKIERTVQPGRVLVHASELIEKSIINAS